MTSHSTDVRRVWMVFCFLMISPTVYSEVELLGSKGKVIKTQEDTISITHSGYMRQDVIMMNNLIDLDSQQKKDSMAYWGGEYYFDFDAKYKEWVEIYSKFQRTGPAYEDMLLLGRRDVSTIYGQTDRYHGKQFLPEVTELYLDAKIPLREYALRSKTGLFTHSLGHGFAGAGYFQNYGLSLYHPGEMASWTFYYNRPDWNNRKILGPVIEQEKRLGRGYQKTVADYFSLDAIYSWGNLSSSESEAEFSGSFQPYVTLLSDRTGIGNRSSLFAVQTEQDLLGTLGVDLRTKWKRLSLDFEMARNFGQAKTKGFAADGDGLLGSQNISHKGYMMYSEMKLDLHEWWITPRTSLMLASGNKLGGSENGLIQGSANRAFSNYSPLNTNLWDSIYQPRENGPLAAMGTGWGANSGILRPGTFGDPYILENLIVPNWGIDITPFKKWTFSLDWWYLAAMQHGVGTWEGESVKLSKDLGNEWDLNVTYKMTDYIECSVSAGYFMPGKYYRAYRDDAGSSFSPFVTGLGDTNSAFYGEMTFTIKY